MIALVPVGEDRFFIRLHGKHAGGITLHSVGEGCFSYGVAIAPAMRRKGAAKAGLLLLFEGMKARGFSRAVVKVKRDNLPSLKLHEALGFERTDEGTDVLTMVKHL